MQFKRIRGQTAFRISAVQPLLMLDQRVGRIDHNHLSVTIPATVGKTTRNTAPNANILPGNQPCLTSSRSKSAVVVPMYKARNIAAIKAKDPSQNNIHEKRPIRFRTLRCDSALRERSSSNVLRTKSWFGEVNGHSQLSAFDLSS